MLDCREQKTIEKLSEELEKAGYTHISFQVVHTKSRTTSRLIAAPKNRELLINCVMIFSVLSFCPYE